MQASRWCAGLFVSAVAAGLCFGAECFGADSCTRHDYGNRHGRSRAGARLPRDRTQPSPHDLVCGVHQGRKIHRAAGVARPDTRSAFFRMAMTHRLRRSRSSRRAIADGEHCGQETGRETHGCRLQDVRGNVSAGTGTGLAEEELPGVSRAGCLQHDAPHRGGLSHRVAKDDAWPVQPGGSRSSDGAHADYEERAGRDGPISGVTSGRIHRISG